MTGANNIFLIGPMGSGKSRMIAVRPDGKGDVTKTHIAWEHTRVVPKRPSMLLVGLREDEVQEQEGEQYDEQPLVQTA